MAVNGFGAVCTAVVALVFAFTKFRDGAWIVLISTPALVLIFFGIHRHYSNLAKNLTLDNFNQPHNIRRQRVLLLLSNVHRGSMLAFNYARTISRDITAVHISLDPVQAEKVQQKWEQWGDGIRLVIIELPYRLLLEPLLEYIDKLYRLRQPDEVITVVRAPVRHRTLVEQPASRPDSTLAAHGASFQAGNSDHRGALPGCRLDGSGARMTIKTG